MCIRDRQIPPSLPRPPSQRSVPLDCYEFFVRLGRPPTQTSSTDAEWRLLPGGCPAADNPYAPPPAEAPLPVVAKARTEAPA
eukprot:402250-Prorocentrum_lima.AAC.1